MRLLDLASEGVGGVALAANDEFFAPKESLLRDGPPECREGVYTDRGKWMDGWETRRRREPGWDWCIVRLGLPGLVRRVVIDTTHFTGNHPEAASLDACGAPPGRPLEELVAGDMWHEVVPRSPLRGGAHNQFEVDEPRRVTHVRLRIHPDGGVARLRVLGEPLPGADLLRPAEGLPDLAGMAVGGEVVDVSDDYFSHPEHLLRPSPSAGMFDGWETRRRRGGGHDWVVVRLGLPAHLRHVVVDTSHFKGNAPGWISMDAREGGDWREVLPRVPVSPDRTHLFEVTPVRAGEVRLNIYPDGGLARLRVLGEPDREAIVLRRMEYLEALYPEEARSFFLTACGSSRFAEEMERRRPFASPDEVLEEAEKVFAGLSPDDWEEAFSSHPRIGEQAAGLSASEQATAAAGGRDAELAEANRRYEERHGRRFLVFASGRTAEEILEEMRRRTPRDPEEELDTAAGEQRKVTALRLRRMLCMEAG